MYDVLIVGAGGAGLTAALSASKSGAKVAIVNKSYPTRAQTSMAQGGINAALANNGEDDTQSHADDTFKSANSLANRDFIDKLCNNAPEAIAWLDNIGVPFSRTADGKIAQRRLGGACASRAAYAQDFTGLKILHTLYDQVLKANIEILNEHYMLNIDVKKNITQGISVLDIRTGEIRQIKTKSVILATGGYSQLYHGFTTNSSGTTGDGIAAALRAGANLSNIEFMQFHPTALKNSKILISESARGAGGYLLNSKLERFTDELAARDKVARAIFKEIENGGNVWLDIRHLGEDFIEENLPQERKLAKLYEHIDPVNELIPIMPIAHYSMGGIEVDENGMSAVNGLFACGECSDHKVHGANRLGGNSLLELIVFGKESGKNALAYAKTCKETIEPSHQLDNDITLINSIYNFPNEIDFYKKRELLGNLFYKNAGLFKNENGLKSALESIKQMQRELKMMGIEDKSKNYNTNLVEFIEFLNLIELAEVLLIGAIARKESRGAHFRDDYLEKNDSIFATPTVSYKNNGELLFKGYL